MPLTVNFRDILDRKSWEMMTPAPLATGASMFLVQSNSATDPYQTILYVTSNTVAYLYLPVEDAWQQVVSPALSGTFGAGACGEWTPNGPTGTATAGGASTITTNYTALRTLTGYTIRLLAGTGAGQERTISTNTLGAASVVTVTSPWTTNPDATTTWVIRSGRFYAIGAGAISAGSWKYFDVASGVWTTLSIVGFPGTWGTDGDVVSPGVAQFATGTATAGAGSTLTNGTKTWTVNQWSNSQIRITSGTGAGQIRTIASNTGTVITVSVAWTTNPDATSVYSIEGNEDFLYVLGNNAVAMYRYNIGANTWTTLAPGVVRTTAPVAGMMSFCANEETDPNWINENSYVNGRLIYSFRGGGTANMDYYDIAFNTWTNTVAYVFNTETFATGSSDAYGPNGCYIQKDATGRFFRFRPSAQLLEPFSTLIYAQSTAVLGSKNFIVTLTEGAVTLVWLYNLRNTGTELFRVLVI